MTITLRPDQAEAVTAVRRDFAKHRRVLLQGATGWGKTVLFSYISRGVSSKNKRVVIMAHRRELLGQISRTLKLFNVKHAILDPSYRGIPTSPVVVASVFTLARRLQHWPAPDLIVGDEAHHFTADSTWGKVVDHFPSARVLGVTATPCRLDGRGLGEMFDTMVEGPTVAELIGMGVLTPAEVYAPPDRLSLMGIRRRAGDYILGDLDRLMNKPRITGNAVEHYKKFAAGTRAVAFCVSVKHAHELAQQFNQHGISASAIDGKMDDWDRDHVISQFRAGTVKVLASCDLISEGFDLPAIECAIMLRPTQSLGLYLQQAGRAIRSYPGKTRTIILDHAGNTETHGMIDDVRQWTLSGGIEQRGNNGGAPRVASCPSCYAMHRPSPTCPKCGYVYVVKSRVVEHVDGDLQQVNGHASPKRTREEELTRQWHILTNIARKRRGLKNPERWAFHVIAGREAKRTGGMSEKEIEALTVGAKRGSGS